MKGPAADKTPASGAGPDPKPPESQSACPNRDPVSAVYCAARRAVILVIGLTIVVFGMALLLTPGPGLLVIVLGLLVLSSEFAWARYWLRRARREAVKADRSLGFSRWLKRIFPGLRRRRDRS